MVKLSIILTASVLLAGCNLLSEDDVTVLSGKTVDVLADTVLTGDVVGTHYIIHDGATLDLGGFVLDGEVTDDHVVGRAFTFVGSNAAVRNGTITGYNRLGVVENGLSDDYTIDLELVTPEVAATVGALYRQRSNSNIVVEDLVTKDLVGSGLYIMPFVQNVTLRHSKFGTSGQMHVYVDHGSRGHVIYGNEFGSTVKREGIAVDGAQDVTITNNTFTGPVDEGHINVYTNRGENRVTREAARNILVADNEFNNSYLGVTVASRHYSSVGGRSGPDRTHSVEVYDNIYNNVRIPFRDLNGLNTVME